MPGNRELREALEAATKLRIAEEYRARLQELRAQFHHTIEVLPGNFSDLQWFNCFAYALGVSDDARYRDLAKKFESSVLINSRFVSGMLKSGEFVELSVVDAQPNDIIFYFSRDVLKHAGQIHSVSPHTIVRSKWGGGEIHEHPLWELPAEHGDSVRYFKRRDPALVLARLETALGDDAPPTTRQEERFRW